MAKNYTHILWDWNGTLLDDSWLCVEVLNILLKEIDKPKISLDDYRSNFEFPVINFYNYLGFKTDEKNFKEVSHKFIALYEARWLRECRLREHAFSSLEKIKSSGIHQSILSAAHYNALNLGLSHFNLTDFFHTISGTETIYAEGKIKKAKSWMLENKLDKEEIILIGDTLHDLDVANEIGIDCALLSGGHCSKEKLATPNSPVFSSLNHLIDAVF